MILVSKVGSVRVTLWCVRVTVAVEKQECVMCVLLGYTSLSTV